MNTLYTSYNYHSMRRRALLLLVTLVLTGVLLFPIVWMIRISIMQRNDLFILPPKWVSSQINLDGYAELFTAGSFASFFTNSVIVALGTAAVSLTAGTLAAYSFSRFIFKGRRILMLITLSAQMFPWALLIISLYFFFSKAGLIDTRLGLMIAHTTFALPLTIWIIKGYFDTIPMELEESAFMDGSSRMKTLWHIILPVTAPGLTAAGIYIFIFSWNDFLFGLTLTTRDEMRTLAPGIAMAFIGEFEYRWVEMMSASVVITVPVLILFLLLQRAFVQGLTAGALKE